MPRRVIDGEAMWASEKIGACRTRIPATSGVYYPWFYPLADANGIVELTNLRVVFSKVSPQLPFLKPEHVAVIIKDFTEKGLLFTWFEAGKLYGYWTGSDKAGRLPKPSERNRYDNYGVEVPVIKLEKYLSQFTGDSIATESRLTRGDCASGGEGFGGGSGLEKEGIGGQPAKSLPSKESKQTFEDHEFIGSHLRISASAHAALMEAFPDFTPDELRACYRKQDFWQVANPARRKKNHLKAMGNWMQIERENRSKRNGTSIEHRQAPSVSKSDERHERAQQAIESVFGHRSKLADSLRQNVPTAGAKP